jgi:hypothetical protein
MTQVKRADWVTCPGFENIVGVVNRVAKDGSWAVVKWPTGTKRMKTSVLEVQTTIPFGGGWTVTDLDRERELGRTEDAMQRVGNLTARCRMCGNDCIGANLIDIPDGSGEHVCKRCMEGICPFCPLMGIELSMWQPVGKDFFGQTAKIGDIPSCDACALVIDSPEYVAEMVAKVRELGLAQ